MLRFALVVVATLTGLGLSGNAAPIPKPDPKALPFFPAKVGAKWVYERNGKTSTETITSAEKDGDTILVKVHVLDEHGSESDLELKISREGVAVVAGLDEKHPPSLVLKLPHENKGSWKTYTGAWPAGTSKLTAYGPEPVEVPAGKYDAIRVVAVDAGKQGDDIRRTSWYAPGVGLVKKETEMGKNTSTCVLKTFTPGK